MKFQSKYTPRAYRAIIDEVAGGSTLNDAARRQGISTVTFYNWRKRYHGRPAKATTAKVDTTLQTTKNPCEESEVRKLQQELSAFKEAYAELALEHNRLRRLVEARAAV